MKSLNPPCNQSTSARLRSGDFCVKFLLRKGGGHVSAVFEKPKVYNQDNRRVVKIRRRSSTTNNRALTKIDNKSVSCDVIVVSSRKGKHTRQIATPYIGTPLGACLGATQGHRTECEH